ncbi:leucine rich repeat-containing protein [Acanthamoeba castellanii str. Neff]|uniref:Leucine rich repeat-containing protein n=1 Tax=Acanthamoeba castellanii (strain ATCC 30010 / Neff) TaxID=1257118 RepID=L8GQU9_ACACF|nr:leucine rich repeat-containing protein [Acanthamoeba castellanii str. Neff]ELR14506.1 leucine rich repeat-containing protein [Acanthamoeba castellanii str. Neff]
MKQGLTGQTSPPSVIYIPSNNIYRRFTFNVAIQKLLKSYPSLNTLNITDCKFGGDFELEYIEICQKNPSLTNLEFRNTSGKRNVHDSLFSVVSKLPIHIRSLTLDNILSKVLQTRQQITSIDLSNNPFYTPQMTVLIKCLSSTYLEHINLTGCSVSDEQACLLFAALAENQTVGSLNLSHNHISRPSVEHIAQFLLRRVDIIFSALSGTNQKELQVLNLEDNKIGHASVYALCKFLQYNHSLTDLNLANNKFREDDGKMILMALPQNRTLQQFKLSRTNKALGVISVGIAAKDAEAIEEILDRNRIESVQMNRGNGDKRRTFGNFQKDYSEYLVQLMQMLCVPHALADIEKKAEYQQCLDFARACLEKGYDVDEFTRNSHFKYVIGQNVTFLKHAAYLLALVGEIRLRLQHLSTLEATKEGYLFKRGGRRKNWKKRYFSLNGLFVFYYVNHQQRTKRKGIIVLEEASIRLGSVHGMMAKYAFEVVTPNRIWILCCDSAEDMDAWVDAIQKVKEVQANKVLKSQLEEIKNGVAAFAGVYDTYNIKYPDPHRKWILQWWFPQCLEVLAFSILGEKQEAAAAVEGTGNGTNSGREKLSASTSSLESSLSREGKRNFIDKLINQFVVNSGIAFYLLTGDYLFDDKMVRSVDGVFQPSLTLANHYKHIQHLKSAVHESLRSSVAKGPFDQQSVNALMQSYSAFKSAQSPETPHKCLDLQGVLYTILNELSDTVLNQLLFLNKHSIREISSQYSDMPSDGAEKNVSVRTVMAAWRMSTRYQFVPYLSDPEDFIFFDLHNLPSDPGKAQKMMHASVGHMRAADDFLVSLMCCSGLQSLQKPMERLLVAIHWLKMHWPGEEKQLFAMDERDSSMAVRLAFIVRAFLAPVKEAHISMHNLDVYDYWTEFCRLATDVVSHIALSARQGISKQHLQEPLELMTTMCTEAVRELVLTLYAPPPASGVEGVAGSQILHAARKY